MSSSTLELFVAAYASESEAGAALKDFQAAQRDGAIHLIDAAVIVHTADGKVKSRTEQTRRARPGDAGACGISLAHHHQANAA